MRFFLTLCCMDGYGPTRVFPCHLLKNYPKPIESEIKETEEERISLKIHSFLIATQSSKIINISV